MFQDGFSLFWGEGCTDAVFFEGIYNWLPKGSFSSNLRITVYFGSNRTPNTALAEHGFRYLPNTKYGSARTVNQIHVSYFLN